MQLKQFPISCTRGILFMFLGIILFLASLTLGILPLLLLSSFMIAIVILCILFILMSYPLISKQIQSIKIININKTNIINYNECIMFKYAFPHHPLNVIFFLYNMTLEFNWYQSLYKNFYDTLSVSTTKKDIISLKVPVRGSYQLNIKLYLTDIFGLFSINFTMIKSLKITISANCVGHQKSIWSHLILRSEFIQSSKKSISNASDIYEFKEFKPYTYGDDIRRLDWRVYTRFQELLIKTYYIKSTKTNDHYSLEIIVPQPSVLGENHLEDLILTAQNLAYYVTKITKKVIDLHVGSSFIIKNFSGNSIKDRQKLAYISTEQYSSKEKYIYKDNTIICVHIFDFPAFIKKLQINQKCILVVIGRNIKEQIIKEQYRDVYFVCA